MIHITITNTPSTQTVEIIGHSDKGKEPCARVTSAFEMLACLLYKDRDQLEQGDGYSFLITNKTKENANQLTMGQAYFNQLQVHYQRTMKVENREVENGENDKEG